MQSEIGLDEKRNVLSADDVSDLRKLPVCEKSVVDHTISGRCRHSVATSRRLTSV